MHTGLTSVAKGSPIRVSWPRVMPLVKNWGIGFLALSCVGFAQSPPAGDAPDFVRDVKPLIENNCLGCHNSKLKMSGLSLATRESALAGGKRGPLAVPGNLSQSKLIEAVKQTGTLRMPPGRMLKAAEIDILEKWVSAGLTWPDGVATAAVPKPNHWSFKAPQRPAEPVVKNAAWVRTPIDKFILARLENENVTPSPETSKSTLIRRLYLDLTGLPPTPEEVNAFGKDASPEAWSKMADRLLASDHFGERWGRRWLDYARYADSDGGSRDESRQIWRYRDWVINAVNQDKPFDQFVVEQLAGDMLPSPTPAQLTATGFHRNSLIQLENGTDREQYRVEAVSDRVEVTGTVLLGLSVGCARCHDHKFDPVSHREYHQFFSIFNNSDDWGNDRPIYSSDIGNKHEVHAPLLEFSSPELIAKRDQLMRQMRAVQDVQSEEEFMALPKEEKSRRQEAIKALRKEVPAIEWTMIMRELPKPRETHIMLGGDYTQKGERVQPGVPAFLHAPKGAVNNRLDFARWLVDPANPLLARVTVNRIWQEYFGRGLVETENDFGTQGSSPRHPELLDWLATEFVRSGWSQKAIHRLIVNSAVYRQSSKVRPELSEKDPRNMLLARQTRLRLDSEIVRDVALRASGLLHAQVGGPSVFPPQPVSAMNASQSKKTWTTSTGPDRYRRGMYTFFWRVTPNPALAVFDSPGAVNACTRRSRSNTPLQALALMNEVSFHEAAQAFARRLLQEAPEGGAKRLDRAFAIALARSPRAAEVERLRAFLAAERDALLSKPDEAVKLVGADAPQAADKIELAVWTSLARVLLNTDEFITRE